MKKLPGRHSHGPVGGVNQVVDVLTVLIGQSVFTASAGNNHIKFTSMDKHRDTPTIPSGPNMTNSSLTSINQGFSRCLSFTGREGEGQSGAARSVKNTEKKQIDSLQDECNQPDGLHGHVVLFIQRHRHNTVLQTQK